MKLKNLLETSGKRLFIDLDGVLVDFHTKVQQHLPDFNFDDYQKDAELRKKFWKIIIDKTGEGEEFWFDSDKMKDADELWDYVSKHDPAILSATGTSVPKEASDQKRRWLDKHYPTIKDIHLVPTGKDKAKFAKDGHVLIDDMERNIKSWEAAGGTGILHKSTSSTIKKLKELGF